MSKRIYLAGPISHLSYEEAKNGWRAEFAKLLSGTDIEFFSPMRAVEMLKGQAKLSPRADEHPHPLSKPRGIITRDFNDIKTCDLMVGGFIGAKVPSIGTAWEYGAAHAMQKPVITIMEKTGNPNDHIFITDTSGYLTSSIEEAAEITKAILFPGV